tara:strand:+ start:53 stop:169 length:117 start_codon:yes stop_codon:yes gene_type:complete
MIPKGDIVLDEGAKSFVKSWNDLMERIVSKSEMLATVC